MDRTGRQPRIHTPNTIHHVMLRGNNRQRVFFGKTCFNYFLKLLEESAKKFDHKILAYCLMTNHMHFVIHIHESSLSSVMQYINFRYARWLNHKQKRIGHLFQGRYRALEVQDETYLINLCRYVHLNPVTAKMVTHLDGYLWSSHQYYVENNAPSWMDIYLMQTAIENKTNLNYVEFMYQPIDREKWRPAMHISKTGEILYDKDIVRKLREKTITNIANDSILHEHLSQDEVLTIVCNHLSVQKTVLLGPSRNRTLARQRILLASYLLQHTKINITEIVKLFQRTRSTLSRQLIQLKQSPEKYFSPKLLQNIEYSLICTSENK